jgi:AhpD family alkylhydroperoxidase
MGASGLLIYLKLDYKDSPEILYVCIIKYMQHSRLDIKQVYPEAYKALNHWDTVIHASPLTAWYRELIKIRASQINGCAYCVHYHISEALALNADVVKIHLIAVWQEASNVFDEKEQMLLQLTEEITYIHRSGLSDASYEKTIALFGMEHTAHIIMIITLINAWNRIGMSLKLNPEL